MALGGAWNSPGNVTSILEISLVKLYDVIWHREIIINSNSQSNVGENDVVEVIVSANGLARSHNKNATSLTIFFKSVVILSTWMQSVAKMLLQWQHFLFSVDAKDIFSYSNDQFRVIMYAMKQQ